MLRQLSSCALLSHSCLRGMITWPTDTTNGAIGATASEGIATVGSWDVAGLRSILTSAVHLPDPGISLSSPKVYSIVAQ